MKRWHITYSVETSILAEWLEHYIEEAWLPIFEHPVSVWEWGGAAILPTRVFRNWTSITKSVVLTIEGKVMSRSGWSAYAEDNYKDLCTIKIVPAGEQESDVFVSSAHAALENYLIALLSEVKKRFGETGNQIIKPDPEDGFRGDMSKYKDRTISEEAEANLSAEIEPPTEDTNGSAGESGTMSTSSPKSVSSDADEPKPWELIEDKGYDRRLLELWHFGFGMTTISSRLGKSTSRLGSRISELRKQYGTTIVPCRKSK